MPRVGLPAKSVDRGGHGKWVVDADQGRDHEQVRQGVCEGVEEGQEAGILDEVWLSRPEAGTTPSARRAAHPLSSSGYFPRRTPGSESSVHSPPPRNPGRFTAMACRRNKEQSTHGVASERS